MSKRFLLSLQKKKEMRIMINILLLMSLFVGVNGQTTQDSLLREFRENTDVQKKYETSLKLSDIYLKTSPETALFYAKYSLQLLSENPDISDISQANYRLGYIYSMIGKPDSALIYLYEALNTAPPDSVLQKISIVNTLGGVYFDVGAYEKALANYFSALKDAELINKKKAAQLYNQIANCYTELGYYDKAEDYINRSIDFYKKNNEQQALLVLYNNLGNLYGYQEKYQEAEIYFKMCLQISTEIGHRQGEMIALTNLGENCIRTGNYTEALNYLKKSETLFQEHNITYNLAGIKNSIGSVYIQTGDYEKAEQYLTEAMEIAKQQKNKKQLRGIYLDFSKLYENTQNFKKSLQFYKLYGAIKDSIVSLEKTELIADMRVKYETERTEDQLKIIQDISELQRLKIESQEKQIKTQRYLFFAIILITISLIISTILIVRGIRLKQQSKYNKLIREHLELTLRFLRSQLNPHFIFNALSSIQGLILAKHYEKANTYLGKFAGLMRNILENSGGEKISLSDEIKTMQLYIELEQLRLNKDLELIIDIDPEIEPDDILIPPMILQPFLENAVKHGISKTNIAGKIEIRIRKKDEESLWCEIKDNGIGINSADTNNVKKNYKSRGTEIVKDRLANFSKVGQSEYKLQIFDRKRHDNQTGTVVKIDIPYELMF